jgi:VWFA-related protein
MKCGGAYSKLDGRLWRWPVTALFLLAASFGSNGQDAPSGNLGQPPPPPANSPAAPQSPANSKDASSTTATAKADIKQELSSRDTGTTFKLRVNLVQVRVVVRDAKGNLVPDLKREDFLLYDQGKLQTVSTFGIETPKTRLERAETAAKTQQQDSGVGTASDEKVVLPQRFVALVFDDIHLDMQDAMVVRNSAKALIESLTPMDRMAIYGTAGQVSQEFTSDKALLEQTLIKIIPRPKMGQINAVSNCPNVNHYMADQYVNKSDPQVLQVVTQEVLACEYQNNPQMLSAAQLSAQTALQEELVAGDTDNDYLYRELEGILRRMRGLPGERVLVLASPGFLLTTRTIDEMGIIDQANRSSIVINTLDARGLYTPDMGDISQPITETPATAGFKLMYRTEAQTENAFVLGDFANGTGGTFFHNSNDLSGGMKRAGEAPEISYVLGFSPQNQKMDGRYHLIKVAMANKQAKYSIQARRGYYAPKKVEDPQEQAKQEIAEAVFSQEEIRDLPLDLQTQYFKTGNTEARLSVVSRIDVKGVHFRKADGRNWDNLTIATAIFDENGNYVTGGEKLLEMRLLDTTYAKISQSGLQTKSSFDLKPGKYMVRQVIRDSEGAQMAARNGAVVIPF